MPKKKGKGYQYSVIVTTDMDADLYTTVDDYDGRSGVPESSFCQDNQGLGMRKRRKKSFVAQQMLVLLNQLAHNLIRWVQIAANMTSLLIQPQISIQAAILYGFRCMLSPNNITFSQISYGAGHFQYAVISPGA